MGWFATNNKNPDAPVETRMGPIPDAPGNNIAAGPYVLDPNHWHTQLPMHKPGNEYWPNVQLDNGVTNLLGAPNYIGFNVYQRWSNKNSRILQSSGGDLVNNQPGPALLDAILQQMV